VGEARRRAWRGFRARIIVHPHSGDRKGVATYFEESAAELITLDAVQTGCGVGTALLQALGDRLRLRGHKRLLVTTTNDNLNALRFYQRRGFHLIELRPGVVEASRLLKPTIPALGNFGIPIRDELTLQLELV
jgi:GNAT superfamily N-acetyltransferase